MKSKVSNILCGSRLQHHSPLLNSCRRGWLQNRLGNRGCVESDAVGKPPEFTRNDGGDITITPHVSVIESKSLTWTISASNSGTPTPGDAGENVGRSRLKKEKAPLPSTKSCCARSARSAGDSSGSGLRLDELVEHTRRTCAKEDNHLEDQTINHQFIHKPFP